MSFAGPQSARKFYKDDGASHGLAFIFYLIESKWLAPTLILSIAYIVSSLLCGGILCFLLLVVAVPVTFVLGGVLLLVYHSRIHDGGRVDWSSVIEVKDSKFNKWKGKKIPIETVIEAYMNGKIDFKGDVYEVLLERNKYFRFCFTLNHAKFYLGELFGQSINHSENMDKKEVATVYNRGNDFYNWFLGPVMIYTSGIFHDEKESLEEAQRRKMELVCRSVHMKRGDNHLDIGCGWGTLLSHSAKHFGANVTGVTLAKEQAAWADETAQKMGVSDRVRVLTMDYRNIPDQQWDKITCLEMAEHVGIKNFQKFLLQVKAMLKDDGLFYLQIAGLRRNWQFEDLVWGCFMGKYIFPAADASCPLSFVTQQLERAGFEIHRVENAGVHYSLTIKAWYDNWKRNRAAIVEKYGEWWYRCWMIFLGWSTIIAAQGSSTVFMITCHKNHKNDGMSVKGETAPFNRMKTFVGPNPIATQQ